MVFNSPCYFYEELPSPKANGSWANGVNTPRSDEDRLKLMELMVFLLQKGVCDEIGITAARLSSYCCQENFWNTAAVKCSDDVTRFQALVDKKKIVISEVVIREILQLNDVEGVVCLPNEEIFAGLAQMGYEKPSTKLTFYKAFFFSQWKFLIHTILQSLSAKRTSWNEFSTAMTSAMICISKGQKFNFSKYIFDSLVRNVDSSSKFYMYPRFIQLIIQNQVGDLSTHTTRLISPALTQKVFANMRRVGKGFSRVETPFFEGMLAVGQPAEEGLVAEQVQVDDVDAAAVEENVDEDVSHAAIPSPPPHDIPSPSQEPSLPPHQHQRSPQAPPQDAEFLTQLQQVLNVCSALSKRVENLETDNATQKLVIVRLKARVKKLEKANKSKSSKLRCLRKVEASRRVKSSADMEDVFNQGRMIDDMDMDKGIELVKDAEVVESEGRHAEKQAEIYNLDLDHSLKVLKVVTAAASQVSAASTTIPAASATIPAAKLTIPAAAPTVVAAYISKRKGVIIRDPEEELPLKTPAETPKPMKKKDQIKMDAEYARKLQEEIDRDHDGFSKDIDWDAAMDHAAKRRKLSEEAQEAEDLRKRLEVVEDEDDDVFVDATPLAQKVHVVDYQIVLVDNKPRIVKDIFSTSKPTNFSDEYLLLTLKTMFEEPDGQDAIWINQKSVHGLALVKRWKLLTSCGVHVITLSTVQLFLLVKRRYPLLRFTLEQLVNVTRLQVEEEREMSLKLLRFTR
nr:hypothetical protein [Tanacetum cinerariifolium]